MQIAVLCHSRLIDVPLLVIFVPPQLHLLIGVIFLLWSWLKAIDSSVANVFISRIGVQHSGEHGAKGFKGNDCRKIARSSHVIIELLRPMAKEDDQKSYDADLDTHLKQNSACRAVARALKAFDVVINRTMGIELHAEGEPAILEFGRSFSSIASLMQPFIALQAWRDSSRETPKVHCVLHEMRDWITKHQKTLLTYSEQGSETLHSFYALHEQNWSVPITGAQLDVREAIRLAVAEAKRLLCDKKQAQAHKISDGTRSGHNKRRRIAYTRKGAADPSRTQLDPNLSAGRSTESVDDPPAPWDQPQSIKQCALGTIVVGPVDHAIQQRMRSVLAFVANRLPGESAVQDRVRLHFDWRRANKGGHPPWRAQEPKKRVEIERPRKKHKRYQPARDEDFPPVM